MRKFSTAAISAILASCMLIQPALATGIPVVDAGANLQLYQQLLQYYQQIQVLRQQYNAIKGSYGMGNLKREVLNQVTQQLPQSWQDVVNLQRAKGQMSQAEYYKKLLKVINDDFLKGNDRQSSAIKMSQQNTLAAFTATDELYSVLTEHQKNVMDLASQIESAPNIKAATDLNTRLQAEVAMVQISAGRLQAIQNQLKATELNTQNQSTIDRRTNFRYDPNFNYNGAQ